MSVSLTVDGDPGGCRAAADDIRTLAGRVDAASDLLARTMTTACGAWSGDSSDQFTAFAKERLHRADSLHDDLHLLWLSLEAFSNGLAEVKSEMKRARAIALRHDIPVHGDTLPEVGEITLEPGQEGALDHAVAVANRAREHEQRLQRGWQEMLDRVSGLVWEPIDLSSVGHSATPSGPLDTVSDLVSDIPGLSDVDPSHLVATAKDVTGVLQGAFTTGTKFIGDALPGGPRIGPVPLIMLMNPHLTSQLMLLKAIKRTSPDVARRVDATITGYARANQKIGETLCKVPSKAVGHVLEKVDPPGGDDFISKGQEKAVKNAGKHAGLAHAATCEFVKHEGALKYADLLVEATDAD